MILTYAEDVRETGASPGRGTDVTTKKRSYSLGIDWFLPGRKQRFATTTQADSLMIELLAEDGLTVREARAALNYPSIEQIAVLDGLEAAGYGDTRLTDIGVQ